MQDNIELQLTILDIIELLASTLKQGNKILLCGNGGSASDSAHLSAEFIGRFKKERKALNVESLSTNTSILTAIGNDYSFDKIFSRQIEAKGSKSDVLIAISTSGNSPNIIEALKQAKKQDMITITLTGNYSDMKCELHTDYIIKVPSIDTARIQEAHVFILHVLTEFVEIEFVK